LSFFTFCPIIGELRIGINSEVNDHVMTKWYHLRCFKLPRQFNKAIDSFVADELTDQTTDLILNDPEKRMEIVDAITESMASKGRKRKADDSEPSEPTSAEGRVAKIQKDFECWKDVDEEGDSRLKKKKPTLSDQDRSRVEAFETYRLMKNDDLHTILRWNRQITTAPNKNVLLLRAIDGHVYGRLGRCTFCAAGKLRLQDDGGEITCYGTWDEATRVRHPCSARYSPEQAPRLHPWFIKKPTVEEEAAMDAEGEDSKVSAKSSAVIEDIKGALAIPAATLEWNLSSNEGIKKAVADLLQLCHESGTPIDLPEDPATARMEVGKILIENKDKSADAVLQLVIDRFGLKAVNEETKQAKVNAIKGSCGNAANAGLVAAFTELSQLCFKEKDVGRGRSYSNVAVAISELPYEITAENSKGLGKGKNKVVNIGVSSAEKIFEFITTGKIQTLEDKRAAL